MVPLLGYKLHTSDKTIELGYKRGPRPLFKIMGKLPKEFKTMEPTYMRKESNSCAIGLVNGLFPSQSKCKGGNLENSKERVHSTLALGRFKRCMERMDLSNNWDQC